MVSLDDLFYHPNFCFLNFLKLSNKKRKIPIYFHSVDASGIDSGMDVDYYASLAEEAVPVAVSTAILRPPPSYSAAVRSLSSPLSTERSVANTSSNGSASGRMNLAHQSNSHSRYVQVFSGNFLKHQ